MLFVYFCRTFWTPAAVQRFRAICTWRSLDASPGRNSTCSCDALGSTTLLKEHPRWLITAPLILKAGWGRSNVVLVSIFRWRTSQLSNFLCKICVCWLTLTLKCNIAFAEVKKTFKTGYIIKSGPSFFSACSCWHPFLFASPQLNRSPDTCNCCQTWRTVTSSPSSRAENSTTLPQITSSASR